MKTLPRLLLLAAALARPAAAQPECPPCECLCRCESPDADPAQLLTGSVPFTVGAGGAPVPVVSGPIVVTSLAVDCPVLLQLRGPGRGPPVPISLPVGRLFIPEGATLEVADVPGLCTGSIVWSGFEPS